MATTEFDDLEELPKWDVALESLINEEYKKIERPLAIKDFQRLATEYTIRFDDIMATLAQLCLHEKWSFEGTGPNGDSVGMEIIDDLFPYGRLEERVARKFSVLWSPRD